MLCKKMVSSKGIVHPCGQCLFCRINRKRDWISRLLLEAACHPLNQFWTLTYETDSLPESEGCGGVSYVPKSSVIHELSAVRAQKGTLFKPDLQTFFKRYRKLVGPIRYYAVGEYGEKLGRPHYHVLAFGASLTIDFLRQLWKHGHVHIGDVERASINYCVEYALKGDKNVALIDLRRQPEFAMMSTVPGIGSYAIDEFRRCILKSTPLPDGTLLIPDEFSILGRKYAVPRFIRNELEEQGFVTSRSALRRGYTDKEILHTLLSRSRVAVEEFKKYEVLWSDDPVSVSDALRQINQQRLLNAEVRQQIFGRRHETL